MKNEKLKKDFERIIYLFGGVGNIQYIEIKDKNIYVRNNDKVKEKYLDLFNITERYSGPPGEEELYYKVNDFDAFEELHDYVFDRKVSEEYKEQLREKIDKEMEMENE